MNSSVLSLVERRAMSKYRAWLLGVLGCASCHVGPSPHPSREAPSGVTPSDLALAHVSTAQGTRISSPPPAECRSPKEPGCDPCWVPLPDGRCEAHAWQSPAPGELAAWKRAGGGAVEPWYNVSVVRPKCPDTYIRCAKCSARDTREIAALGARPECDCRQPIGEDPCEVWESCGCYCETKLRLMESCPEAFPDEK